MYPMQRTALVRINDYAYRIPCVSDLDIQHYTQVGVWILNREKEGLTVECHDIGRHYRLPQDFCASRCSKGDFSNLEIEYARLLKLSNLEFPG